MRGPLRARDLLRRGSEGAMAYDRREWDERQLQSLKWEIAGRLRPVCQCLPDEEFEALVERIARVQRKYEQQRSSELFPSTRESEQHHPTD